MATVLNTSMYAGDSLSLSGTALDSAGAVIDLTGATIASKFSDGTRSVIDGSIGSGITVVSAAAGTFTLAFAPADTDDFEPNTYRYSVTVTSSGGTVTTVLVGRIRVLRNDWGAGMWDYRDAG
jgi:hypothetical protein